MGLAAEQSVEGEAQAEREGLGSGVVIAEGTIGEMGEGGGDADAVAELAGQFDCATERHVEPEVQALFGVVVSTAEGWGQRPGLAEGKVDEDAKGGVELAIFSGAGEEQRAEAVETEGGAVFDGPEGVLPFVEDLRGADVDAQQRRRGFGGEGGGGAGERQAGGKNGKGAVH